MATLLAAPTACTFDSLGLFTHGEFRCFTSPNPCLSLFTHGEFPRAAFVGAGVGAPPDVGSARKRQRRYKVPEVIWTRDDEEAIVLSLLLDDDDDDWW